MATLLCISQFIALNFLVQTFASGHCSLWHTRGRKALFLPACLPGNAFMAHGCFLLFLFLACCNHVHSLRVLLHIWGWWSRGIAFWTSDLLNRLGLDFVAGGWLLGNRAVNFKKICSQVYTSFILYLIASQSNHSLPYKSLVKLCFTIEP